MNKEINVPSSLSQIPLNEYIKLLDIIEKNKEDEKNMLDTIVQYYTGDSKKEIKEMKQADYDLIINSVFQALQEKSELTMVFQHQGLTFGFIPKLEDMSVKEYLELDATLGQKESWNEAMAILYRPVNKVQHRWLPFRRKKKVYDRYDIEEYESSSKYSDILSTVPANIVAGAIFFFVNLGKDLSKSSLTFLEKQVAIEKCPQKKEVLEKSIAGIHFLQSELEVRTEMNTLTLKL